MQQPAHQAFIETTTVNYPPAWDTTSGPTVTRTFNGTVVPNNYAVPGAVPLGYSQSPGADVSHLVAGLRQRYRDVEASALAGFPETPTTVSYVLAQAPAPAPAGGDYSAALLFVGLVIAAALLGHGWLTSPRRGRSRWERVGERRPRRDRVA